MLLSISELIKASWHLYKNNWRGLRVFMLLLFLPMAVLFIVGVLGKFLDATIPSSALTTNIITIIIFAVSLLFNVWATIGLTRALRSMHRGGYSGNWKVEFGGSMPLLWPFIYTSLLATLIVVGGTLLFIIPGIVFALWYAFVPYTVILDGQKGVAALKASKQLVSGRWWGVLIRVVIPAVFYGFISIIVTLLLSFLVTLPISSEALSLLASNIMSAVVGAILAPLTSGVMVILYENAKATPVQNPSLPSSPAA